MITTAAPAGAHRHQSDWYYNRHPAIRLALRWTLIAALTLLAFHRSLLNLVQTTAAGSIGGYVWTVPAATALAAAGLQMRRRTDPPIYDRQTDIIFGAIGFGLSLMVQGVLLPRYADYFHLLRLDLLAMWLFVGSSSIVLFGIRPVLRFGWAWFVSAAVFMLPYQVAVTTLGGGKFVAGLVTLVIGAIATAVAAGRTRRRATIGGAAAFAFGAVVLVILRLVIPGAPLPVYQQVPTLSAIVVVGGAALLEQQLRRADTGSTRPAPQVNAPNVWAEITVVTAVAVALALIGLPTQLTTTDVSRTAPYALTPGRALTAPPGWSISAPPEFIDVQRYYGDDAVLVRQRMTADTGDPRFDKHSAARTLVVDSIVSDRPFAFDAYPARVLYDTTGARLSAPRMVDLGDGVRGSIISVVDDRLLVTWDVLLFAWGGDGQEQTVTVFAVDNHEADAPFPRPANGLMSTLHTLFTVLLRGNAVVVQRRPDFKDAELLTEFGQGLVAAQFTSAESTR
ncbi:hypothetical protein [Mycolicibacterium mengxianglii]|uniref:hypothetical protein n=1 Tax=Mycolicibacterium mengxianglii TaxID=2736649 RepID=UPI0018EEE9E3|nr:hypothetical protein [Mycolicibacterium mengxianglii]